MQMKIFPLKLDEALRNRLKKASEMLGMPMAKMIKLSLEKKDINLEYYEELAKHYGNTNNKENVS